MSEVMGGAADRRSPGQGLYAELTGRFARVLRPDVSQEDLDRAVDELGFTYLYSVDESDAAFFRDRMGLGEDNWRDRFLRAVALHRHGRLEDAEKQYKALQKEESGHIEIDYNLAALFLQQGQIDAARKHLDIFEKGLGQVDSTPFVAECRQRARELREELES